MTYKTRQEVLRAAADWMDVCEAAGVEARCRVCTATVKIKQIMFDGPWEDYEFPLALLEGKEVWVGSELYDGNGVKFKAVASDSIYLGEGTICSWNPLKPKTVTLTANLSDVEACANSGTLPVGLYHSCRIFLGD